MPWFGLALGFGVMRENQRQLQDLDIGEGRLPGQVDCPGSCLRTHWIL